MFNRIRRALVPWVPLLAAVVGAPASIIVMHLPQPVAIVMFFAIALVGATTSYIVDDDVKQTA